MSDRDFSFLGVYSMFILGASNTLFTGFPFSGCFVIGSEFADCSTSKTSPSEPSGSIVIYLYIGIAMKIVLRQAAPRI